MQQASSAGEAAGTSVEAIVEQKPLLTDYNNPEYYINRELSHLNFNIRVLDQALNDEHPLLERLRFLLIFSSNMDEFFEIRVAGLKQQIEFAREQVGLDGMPPSEVLKEISRLTHQQVERQYNILNEVLFPALREQGIHFVRRSELTDAQRSWIRTYFFQEVMPIVSPIGLDPAHPFPRLANKILNFIVELDGKDAFGRETGMAIIPAPRSLPRLVRLPPHICPDGGDHFLFLSSIIHQHAEDLFPGMIVKGCYQFRLTRNSDLSLEDDDVEDLATALQGELLSRRYGDAVRLEVVDNCPRYLSEFLLNQFGLTEDERYEINGPVNLTRLFDVCDIENHEEKQFTPFTPGYPKGLPTKSDRLLDTIAKGDVLLMHPFQSFTPVVDLLRQSAKDPQVLAIKQTLYRTGSRSQMVDALVEAARHGKEVTVVVEIRARFDEEENLKLARRLQEAGAIVVYGVVGYKTHSKLMLIVRREGRKIVRYAHLGTGNYHAKNARLYTDYSLLTCDPDLTSDVHKVFQQLTGMGKAMRVKKLLHAPFTLKKGLIERINHEAERAKNGEKAHIIIKVNSVTEPVMIKALYKASQAGVKIDMVVRGICCLRPGIVGLSENIRVFSIVGRFLEHTRVFYFYNGGDEQVLCASADLMIRNLDKRVETCFPVENPKLVIRIRRELESYLSDNTRSWTLLPDGTYDRKHPVRNQKERNAQQFLLETLSN
ncbi:polyphosphate kinase 1 [Sansalvadorimonas sp. 2012CJ34-2]|uniref:Polyphosphate kinase n=1 Tax=Parendozoicomonas callyspongiae TaxID=2942213 RepID=A0ABT0PIX8_9GAMM|nr:polyphosphate kinase 1 [Sansalvadorimonas sp. 2012CJ34-2]MCL6271283.1 polyphosphate kinase 1 [Sansalvadorimonas sp. 2012CJ34-2]